MIKISGVVRKKLQHHHWEATDEIVNFIATATSSNESTKECPD